MKLKQFLRLKMEPKPSCGNKVDIMVWYPEVHLWIMTDFDIYYLTKRGLLKSTIILRSNRWDSRTASQRNSPFS